MGRCSEASRGQGQGQAWKKKEASTHVESVSGLKGGECAAEGNESAFVVRVVPLQERVHESAGLMVDNYSLSRGLMQSIG